MNPFYEGQTVVCINDSFIQGNGRESSNHPHRNEVLVVDEVMGEFVRFEKYDIGTDEKLWQYWEHKNFAPVEDDLNDNIWMNEQIKELVEEEEIEFA